MTKKLLAAAVFLSAALTLGSCGKSSADSDIPAFAAIDGDYLKTGGDGSNWAMTGFSYDEQRHSPLKLINDSNVQDLGIAWFADLPDARGQEATPVVVDGKMFVSTAWSKVFAYDAKTGKPLWSFDPKVDKSRGVKACCDVVNRGVAFWKGSVFVGTIDGRLISLNASTGKQNWSAQTLDLESNGTITGVPRVVKDKVVIGFGGAEFGARGDQRARGLGGFDDQDAVGEAGDQAIAQRKVMRPRMAARFVFGDQRPVARHAPRQRPIGPRHIDPAAQDGDGGACRIKGGFVRSMVDAARQAGDDQDARTRQGPREAPRLCFAVGTGRAAADDGDGVRRGQQFGAPACPKAFRRAFDARESRRP